MLKIRLALFNTSKVKHFVLCFHSLGLGGVFVGVGVVPEFFCKSDSTNAINSMVSNPLNEMLSVGGSSGGSAAAVAAGLAHIGLGTEFGGSIVTPATCCGVLGYKSVDTNGFFVNSLSDLLFVLNNLRKEFPNSSGDYDKVGNITIGTIALPDPFVVDQEIISSTMLMYEYLAGYFECRELNLFDKVYLPIWSKTGNINTLWREKVKPIASANKCDDPVLRELLNVNSEGLAQAEGWKSTTTTDFNNFLSTVDVLVIPATSSKAWPQAHYHPKSFHTSEWKTMYSEKLSQECMPTNLLFTQHNIFSLPSVWAKKICITMPIGFTASLESGIIPLAVTLVLNDATDGKCQDREKWNKFIAVALQVQEFCMQQVSK